jgi:hypothetical protein
MQRNLNLIELMRSHFASSRQWLGCSIICNIGVVAISLLTSIDVFRGANLYIPVSLFLVQTGAYVLRQLSINHFSCAENVRSTVMLKDSLGLDISDLQLKWLYETLTHSTMQEPLSLVPYYASPMPPGPRTMLQLLAESCTHTSGIARRSFEILLTVTTITGLSVVALISLMISTYATHAILVKINMSILVLLSIWATLDLATMSMRYRELHDSCSQILSKCVGFQRANVNILDELMSLLNEYSRALAASSPFPINFYEADKAHLNQLWPARSLLKNQL